MMSLVTICLGYRETMVGVNRPQIIVNPTLSMPLFKQSLFAETHTGANRYSAT